MATKRKGKTIPCEGCRERKKKCSAGQPCERCKRLGIQCYYLQSVAPPKLECIESVNTQEIKMHIEALEDIMRNMEKELYLLKPPFSAKQVPNSNSNDNVNGNDKEARHDIPTSSFSDQKFDTNCYRFNDISSKDSNDSNNAVITVEKTFNWQLKFQKDGDISIHTDILSYAHLMKHIETLGNISHTFPIIKQPTLASLSAGGGYLVRNVLFTVVRRGNFRAILDCIQNQTRRQIISASTLTPPQTLMLEFGSQENMMHEKKDLTLQLVNTYFSCQFLNRVVFHQRTFYDMFVKGKVDLEASPVVCALSAAVLTMHCKHVIALVPYHQQLALGEYYFDKARQAVSLQFDEPSMETMIAYLFMSLYKSNLLQPQDANMYLEIAIRMRQILAETIYKHPPKYSSTTIPTKSTNTKLPLNTTPGIETCATILSKTQSKPETFDQYLGEYETFKRLHAGFQDCVQFIQFVNNQRGIPVKTISPSRNEPSKLNQENRCFKNMFQAICAETYDSKPMPDESKHTVRAIMKEHYIGLISRVVSPYFKRVRWQESDMVPLSFLMKTEEDLKQVYYQQIPADFRLSDSIFEEGISDAEFKKRLKEDARCDIVSVTIAARYYQSLLALHEPFVPTIRRFHSKRVNGDLLTLIQPENIEDFDFKEQKKRKRRGSKTTLAATSPSSQVEDKDEDDDPNDLSVYSLKAQQVCYRCSIIVVRLLEFQCNTLQACTIPTATLLCAWDTLLRNSCLEMEKDDLEASGVNEFLSAKDIEFAREYAVRCIEVLRRGYLFNGAEREVFEYYERIESQLLTALCKSASPTAKYWEPVANW